MHDTSFHIDEKRFGGLLRRYQRVSGVCARRISDQTDTCRCGPGRRLIRRWSLSGHCANNHNQDGDKTCRNEPKVAKSCIAHSILLSLERFELRIVINAVLSMEF